MSAAAESSGPGILASQAGNAATGYQVRTDLAAVVNMAEELGDLEAVVEYAPHPPAPNDYGKEPIVRVPLGDSDVEIHEVLDDDMPVVQQHLERTCYVVQTYTGRKLTMQIITFKKDDASTLARVLAAWTAQRGSSR